MAFIQQGTTVYSFAEYDDVVALDPRLFQANEGLTTEVIEDALMKSTDRILSQIKASEWWKSYYQVQGGTNVVYGQTNSVPAPQANLIIARRAEFTDLCVYHTLSEYILPGIADFGDPDNAERQKIAFFGEKYRDLIRALIEAGDWYDFNADGSISNTEQAPSKTNLVRVR